MNARSRSRSLPLIRAAAFCGLAAAAWALVPGSPSLGSDADGRVAAPANRAPTLLAPAVGVTVRAGQRAVLAVEALDPDVDGEGAAEAVWLNVALRPDPEAPPAWLAQPSWSAGPSERPRLEIGFAPPRDAAAGTYVLEAGATDSRGLSRFANIILTVLPPRCGPLEIDGDGDGTCVRCPEHRLPDGSRSFCAPCPAGTERPADAPSCTDCPVGEASRPGMACAPVRAVSKAAAAPPGASIGGTAQPRNAADTTAPTIVAADYAGATLTLTLSEPVWAEVPPGRDDFVVRSNAVLRVAAVAVPTRQADAGATIALTLDKAVAGSARVQVSYIPNADAAARPRDAAGNRMGVQHADVHPRRTLSVALDGVGESGIAEDVGEVGVTVSLGNPPDSGGYTGCRLRLAPASVAGAADVGFAGAGLNLNSGNGWQAAGKLLRIVDDALAEGDEALAVEAYCQGGAAGMKPSAVGLASTPATTAIADNESRTVTLAAAPSRILETAAATPVTVTATLDGQATERLDLPLTLSGTAGAGDYRVSGTQSIAIEADAASGSTVLRIDPAADRDDVDGTIAIGAALAGYAVSGTAVTLAEPAPPPKLIAAVASPRLNEDAGSVTVRLTLRNPPASGGYTGCGLRLAAGSQAQSPADVTFPNQRRLTAANGWTAQGPLLNVVDDALTERNEALVVEGHCKGREPGTKPAPKALGAKALRLTIRDNDGVRPLALAVAPSAIGETLGEQSVQVTATVADAPTAPLTVSLSLGPGAYSVAGALSIRIPAGATSGTTTLAFTPTDDGNAADDRVSVSATAPGHDVADASLTIAEPTAVDGADLSGLAVRLTVSPTAIREGSSGGHRLLARLDGVDTPPVDVSMALDIGGTAARGASGDYRLTGAAGWKRLKVNANDAHREASSRVTVAAFADSAEEGDETVTFTVSQVTWGTTVVALKAPAVATLRISEAWDRPEAPTNLTAAPAPGNETHGLDLRWSPVSATPLVEGYVVRHREAAAPPSPWREARPQPGAALAIAGLKAGTRYEIRVRARSAAGDGPESGSAHARTADAPCPMSAPTVVAAPGERSSSELNLSWRAPACGASVAGYRLRHRPDPGVGQAGGAWTETAAAGTSATLKGLAADTAYAVAARVLITGGDKGPWSPEGRGRTGLDARLPPRMGAPAVAPHAVDGASRLDATWTRVAWTDSNDVSHPIAEYQYRYRADGGAWTAPTGAQAGSGEASAMTRSISGLPTGTWHEVQVRAVNRTGGAVHPGKWSEPGRGRTWGAPDRVEEPAAHLTGRAVEVAWEAPHDGGSPITGYDVDYRLQGSGRWRTHPYGGCAMGACAAEASINGLARQVRVRAENALGMGKWSRTARVQSRKRLRASYGAAAATVNEGESLLVTVRLDSAADRAVSAPVTTIGGAGAFRLDGLVGRKAEFGLGALEQTFTFAALQDADEVNEKVTLGFGALPDGVSLAAPASLVVTINDDDAANGGPAFDAGAAAVRSVAENAAPGTAVGAPIAATDPEGDPLTYTLGGAHAALFAVDASSGQLRVGVGADLDFEVAPVRSVTVEVGDGKDGSGASDASADAAIAVTVNLTDVAEPPSAPAAPTLTPTATTLAAAWAEPDSTGPPITGYELHYRAIGEAGWTDAQLSGTARTATLSGLSAGAAHEVRVRAANDEGVGAWSAAAKGNTLPTASLAADALKPEIADGNATVAVTLSASAGAADGTLTGAWLERDGEGAVTVLADGIALAGGAKVTRAVSSSAPGPRTFGFRATHALDGRTGTATQWLIVNWRPKVILEAAPASVAEDGGPVGIRVTARLTGTALSAAAKTVAVSVAGGTATAGADFEAVDGFTIGIAGGGRSGTGSFTLKPVADAVREGPETVAVTATASDGGPITAVATAVSIVDADPKLSVTAPANGHVTGTTGSGGAQRTVIDCGSGSRTLCAATLAGGTKVTLTAQADGGHLFDGWTGACSGTAGCALTLGTDVTVGARFAAARTLTVARPANGRVVGKVGAATVIDCGSDCAETLADGTAVALSASADESHRFGGWGGACAAEASASCAVTLDADRTVSVTFVSVAVDGRCDETAADACAAGTLNRSAVTDSDSHHRWRCDGTGGGANSRTCARAKDGCAAGSRDWSFSGNACTGSVTDAASGQTRMASDGGGPATGSASFKCDDGAWTEQPGSVCGLGCAARTVSRCELASTAHGGSSGTCDATSSGNCSYSCSNGTWTRQGGQCNARCPGVTRSWTVGDDSCTDALDGGPHGSSRSASDNSGSARGRASYLCSDGNWLEQPGSTCERQCRSTTHAWSVGSAECEARIDTLPSGWSDSADDDTYPDTGTARYACEDGAWKGPESASCHKGCAGETIDGCVLTDTVHDDDKEGACAKGSGSCEYRCNNGTWEKRSNSCPVDCDAATVTWKVGSDTGRDTCSASVAKGSHGDEKTAQDGTDPTRGSATFQCEYGVWKERSGSSCGRECSESDVSWGKGTEKCTATRAETPHGSTLTVMDGDYSKTGSATYMCNDGEFGEPTDASCHAGCAGETVSGCKLSNKVHGGKSGACLPNYTDSCAYSCDDGKWGKDSNTCVLPTYTVTCNPVPTNGRISGDGFTCPGGVQRETVPVGTTVGPLTATPNAGYRFDGWILSGSECEETSPLSTCTFKVKGGAVNFSARFSSTLMADAGGTNGVYYPERFHETSPFGDNFGAYILLVNASATGGIPPYAFQWSGQSAGASAYYWWPLGTTGTKDVKVTVTDQNDIKEDSQATATAVVQFSSSSDALRSGAGSAFAFEVPLGDVLYFVWGGDGAVTARSGDAKVVGVSVSSPLVRVGGLGVGRTEVVLVTNGGELRIPVEVK